GVGGHVHSVVEYGGQGSNTPIGPKTATFWEINSDGIYNDATDIVPGNFVGSNTGGLLDVFHDPDPFSYRPFTCFFRFQNLTGGAGQDPFSSTPAAPRPVWFGSTPGGLAPNVLDSPPSPTPATVNLAAGTATGVGGTFTGIASVIGSN